MGHLSFVGTIRCELHLAPDGWSWIGYLGVNEDHPLWGSSFTNVQPLNVDIHHVSHKTGSDEGDALWWFSFETNRFYQYSGLDLLRKVGERLYDMVIPPLTFDDEDTLT